VNRITHFSIAFGIAVLDFVDAIGAIEWSVGAETVEEEGAAKMEAETV
jgi:hypothetical protein